MATEAKVPELPKCDFCRLVDRVDRDANYDGKTTSGPWANMCDDHFAEHGVGLGTGFGQRLILDDRWSV